MKHSYQKFWPKHLSSSLTAPDTSLWDNLEISARRYPDKPALIFFGRMISYRELRESAERLAGQLRALRVGKGDRVLLDMQNCPQLIVAHFAIMRANAVVVPVNPMNRSEEIRHFIADPGAKVAITTADLAGEVAAASNALPRGERLQHLIVSHFSDFLDDDAAESVPQGWRDWLLTRHPVPQLVGGHVMSWLAALDNHLPLPHLEVGPGDLAVLPYTSGTTGLPKGCMHLHKSIMHNAVASTGWWNVTTETVALMVLPMFHITGMVSVMHTHIYAGATLVVMPRWDREEAGRLISFWKVTSWTNIPTMVIDLMGSPNFSHYDLTSLVHIGGGGAAMPQAVAQRLLEQFDLRYVEGYGLTETAAPTHCNPPDHPKQQCLGIPFIGCEARIIDPQMHDEMPVGEEGEIIVRGPMVFSGYWKQPEATAAAFIDLEGKRFFRTGDLGRVDEDGYYFITDRLKRMINASGFKVWPAEVEAIMFRHPAIQEACVIASKDSYRGETVKALVVLSAADKGPVSEQEITDWCREHMAAYKVPRIVQFVESLPKSGSGKVMWRLLQEREQAEAQRGSFV